MATEQSKGTITRTKGKVQELFGRLTGNDRQQAEGKAKQVQGDAQTALGDAQDAVREPDKKAT